MQLEEAYESDPNVGQYEFCAAEGEEEEMELEYGSLKKSSSQSNRNVPVQRHSNQFNISPLMTQGHAHREYDQDMHLMNPPQGHLGTETNGDIELLE